MQVVSLPAYPLNLDIVINMLTIFFFKYMGSKKLINN